MTKRLTAAREGPQMKAIFYGALMALIMTNANAAVEEDVHSAHAMLPYCKLSSRQTMASAKNALLYGQCFGMISGVVAMMELLRQAQASGQAELDPILCTEIPGPTTIEGLINVVVKYGETHPDQAHERLEILAFKALHDAWPCKK